MDEIKIYRNGERVLIEAEVISRAFKGEEVRYGLKDPRTGKLFDYTYGHDEIYPNEKKKGNEVQK